jgi:hypothetical protein
MKIREMYLAQSEGIEGETGQKFVFTNKGCEGYF